MTGSSIAGRTTPDDYRDDHAALGFRRLSIIDLAGGHQPLSNEDGTIWTVFNGEIYNFPALRHRLEAKGHVLRSQGDTEVLVHLYEDEGTGMFSLLRGMFALAIWDAPRRTLWSWPATGWARSRSSIATTAAAWSSPASSRPCWPCPRVSCPAGSIRSALDQYLTYGYVPHPRTILEGSHKLPPAHYAVWHDGRLAVERYWQPDWNRERASADRGGCRRAAGDTRRRRARADDRRRAAGGVPLGGHRFDDHRRA